MYLPDEFGVELIRRSLNEELDPEDFVEHYRALSEKYFAEAKEFFGKFQKRAGMKNRKERREKNQ